MPSRRRLPQLLLLLVGLVLLGFCLPVLSLAQEGPADGGALVPATLAPIPFTVPGGRLGRAGYTAAGDVLVNAIHQGDKYSAEQAMLDFGTGFIGDLAGGGLGELIARYGSKGVARGLHKLGIQLQDIRRLTGVYPTLVDPSKLVISQKIAGQMPRRGWAKADIDATITNPALIRQGGINRATNNSATYYYRPDGHYVVIDDVTGEVVQISNLNDPNWIDEMTNQPITPIN